MNHEAVYRTAPATFTFPFLQENHQNVLTPWVLFSRTPQQENPMVNNRAHKTQERVRTHRIYRPRNRIPKKGNGYRNYGSTWKRIAKKGNHNNWNRISKREEVDHINQNSSTFQAEQHKITDQDETDENTFQEGVKANTAQEENEYNTSKEYDENNNGQYINKGDTLHEEDDKAFLFEWDLLPIIKGEEEDSVQQNDKDIPDENVDHNKLSKDLEYDNIKFLNLCKSLKCERSPKRRNKLMMPVHKWKGTGDLGREEEGKIIGQRSVRIWGKRDGGRATSGSWNPAGKRFGGRQTSGSWSPAGKKGGGKKTWESGSPAGKRDKIRMIFISGRFAIKRYGGRTTSGSWSPAGKRDSRRATAGTWSPFLKGSTERTNSRVWIPAGKRNGGRMTSGSWSPVKKRGKGKAH